MEPIIVKDWDSLPPEVVGEGILYSTRILCRQHHEMKARIAGLEHDSVKASELSGSLHVIAEQLGLNADNYQSYLLLTDGINHKIDQMQEQLKTAKRDAILEAIDACMTKDWPTEVFRALDKYAKTIGEG